MTFRIVQGAADDDHDVHYHAQLQLWQRLDALLANASRTQPVPLEKSRVFAMFCQLPWTYHRPYLLSPAPTVMFGVAAFASSQLGDLSTAQQRKRQHAKGTAVELQNHKKC